MQQSKSKLVVQQETYQRKAVLEYFDLVRQGKFKEGLRFFSPDCKTHNPFISGSIEKLVDAMVEAGKGMGAGGSDVEFAVRRVLVDGDFVAAYTVFLNSKSKPGDGGLRQVHLFRFDGEKVVEYWDITQQLTSSMPNAAGAF